MAEKFEVGDVVTLKSEGPDMTVSGVSQGKDATVVSCVWFNGKKQDNGVFDARTLKHVPPPTDDDPPDFMTA